MPALYLATRATFSALRRFIQAQGCCDESFVSAVGLWQESVTDADVGACGVCGLRSVGWALPPSPLQNKPLPQPQESGTWGTVPPGHELLQSCWCPSPWDRGSLRASFYMDFLKKSDFFFSSSPPASVPPTLGEEECRLMHVAFFPVQQKFFFVCLLFFFNTYMEQCMISICCSKKRVFSFFFFPIC